MGYCGKLSGVREIWLFAESAGGKREYQSRSTPMLTSIFQDWYSSFPPSPPALSAKSHLALTPESSCGNPYSLFSNCMQNDVTLVRHCWTSFRNKTKIYNYSAVLKLILTSLVLLGFSADHLHSQLKYKYLSIIHNNRSQSYHQKNSQNYDKIPRFLTISTDFQIVFLWKNSEENFQKSVQCETVNCWKITFVQMTNIFLPFVVYFWQMYCDPFSGALKNRSLLVPWACSY